MHNFNIDLALQCVKTLVDSCRCVNCDHLNGTRSRYNCGHSVCKDCPVIYDACLLCLPTSNSTLTLDNPQTERAQHASELLNTFQDLFNVDVYRKLRISEQLKIEKEVFPECIQAPVTYHNKRKSSSLSEKYSNRLSLIYDDSVLTSNKRKMEKSTNYVQEWLDQHETNFQKKRMSRKPLSDLSINTSNSLNIIKDNKLNTSKRKRRFNLSELTDNTYEHKTFKKLRKDSTQKIQGLKYESGMVLDDDICVINDSQSEVMDKDTLALMAVLEADKKDQNILMDADIDFNEKIMNKTESKPSLSTSTYKTPFYKKGILLETCNICAKYTDQNVVKKYIFNTNNVSVTIESKSFLTTIKFSEIKTNNNIVVYKSVAIQTDIENNYDAMSKNEATSKDFDASNHNENQNNNHGASNKTKCVIIEDSDSGSSSIHDDSKEIEVQVDVHKSSNNIDYIFKPLETQEYENRIIPKIRGHTPASSDSSDKENYDPNKQKQSKAGTKNIKNKKFKI